MIGYQERDKEEKDKKKKKAGNTEVGKVIQEKKKKKKKTSSISVAKHPHVTITPFFFSSFKNIMPENKD